MVTKVPQIYGNLHPFNFPHTEVLKSISPNGHFFRHKNLEVASFENNYVSNDKNTVTVFFEGDLNPQSTIAGYEKEGEAFFSKLRGEFILALFDKEKEVLYLLRDPIGKKVVYWTYQGENWSFGTDLKGLLATGIVPQTPSPMGLSSYLYFGFIPQDFSPILDVNKLLPGHALKIDLKGHFSIFQYFSLKDHFNEMNLTEATEFEPPLSSAKEHIQDLTKIIWTLGEPLADINMFRLWKLRRNPPPIAVIGMDPSKEPKSPTPTLAYRLAHLPTPLLKRLLPLTDIFFPALKWKILRNIDINYQLMSYLPAIALFDTHARKKVSPFLFRYFDPEVFIERFHRLAHIELADQLFYLKAKTTFPDSTLFQYDKLLPTTKMAFSKKTNAFKVPKQWCNAPEFRELFELLETGMLVEERLVSPKWIRHNLGFPYLIERNFNELFALLTLEIWFRLFISHPIGKIPFNTHPKDLLS